MDVFVSVVCYKSKTLSNGESPLMLQIFLHGKRKYKSLGVSIDPKHWDFKKDRPKPGCPNGEFIQKIILDKVTSIHKSILQLNAEQTDLTLTRLFTEKGVPSNRQTIGEFYLNLISQLQADGKTGNRKVYVGSYNSIKAYSKGNNELQFSDIDADWLSGYERWLRSKGNKETTISLMFRTLRSIYNKALEARCARKSDYPFDRYKISKFDVKTRKRSIAKADILKIMQLDVSGEKPSIKLSRDIFIFSYLTGGINFSGIANLKPLNICDGRIIYLRQKTGKQINIQINDEAAEILNRYNDGVSQRGYLFPILDARIHKTAQQKQDRIHKCLSRTNKDLKHIAKLAGIDFNLSTYAARHSFATVLKNSGVNVALISKALGHSDLTTTQIYLDSFENRQIDDALKNLL